MENIYNKLINNELDSLIKNIENFSSNTDGHVKGVFVESTLRNLIKKFIPKIYDVSNGWIIDENFKRSDERDILIFDRNKAPTFLFDIGVGFIPLISLIYDIQIKTSLSKETISKAIAKYNEKIPINVLLALKGKDLLRQYKDIDENYLINPKIKVISSEEDYYYFWRVESFSYWKIFGINFLKNNNIDIKSKDKVKMNGEYLKELLDNKYIKKYEWIKVKRTHNIEGFIVGLLNTLYNDSNVSKYILDKDDKFIGQIVTQIYCDDKNNKLYEEVNFDTGITSNNKSFILHINENNNISISLNK